METNLRCIYCDKPLMVDDRGELTDDGQGCCRPQGHRPVITVGALV